MQNILWQGAIKAIVSPSTPYPIIYSRSWNYKGAAASQSLTLDHVYIHRLDYTLYSLLATGYIGVGTVSRFLDTRPSFPITWDCSGWGF